MSLTLGQKLKRVRVVKSLSLKDLAKRSGVSISLLSRYESDRTDPTAKKLKAVAAALDIRAGYLLDEIPELEEIKPEEVALRESLRLFLANKSISEGKKKRYWQALDLPQAPKTVQGWKEFDELMHRILGRKVRG